MVLVHYYTIPVWLNLQMWNIWIWKADYKVISGFLMWGGSRSQPCNYLRPQIGSQHFPLSLSSVPMLLSDRNLTLYFIEKINTIQQELYFIPITNLQTCLLHHQPKYPPTSPSQEFTCLIISSLIYITNFSLFGSFP